MDAASTTKSASARRRRVKFTSAPNRLRMLSLLLQIFGFQLLLSASYLLIRVCFVVNYVQSIGIKGKMIAKKNYAEKAQMKKT